MILSVFWKFLMTVWTHWPLNMKKCSKERKKCCQPKLFFKCCARTLTSDHLSSVYIFIYLNSFFCCMFQPPVFKNLLLIVLDESWRSALLMPLSVPHWTYHFDHKDFWEVKFLSSWKRRQTELVCDRAQDYMSDEMWGEHESTHTVHLFLCNILLHCTNILTLTSVTSNLL